MKVRALPTWRKPVGEGANLTRGAALELAPLSEVIVIGTQTFDVTGQRKSIQATGGSAITRKLLIRLRNQAWVTRAMNFKFYCLGDFHVKP